MHFKHRDTKVTKSPGMLTAGSRRVNLAGEGLFQQCVSPPRPRVRAGECVARDEGSKTKDLLLGLCEQLWLLFFAERWES